MRSGLRFSEACSNPWVRRPARCSSTCLMPPCTPKGGRSIGRSGIVVERLERHDEHSLVNRPPHRRRSGVRRAGPGMRCSTGSECRARSSSRTRSGTFVFSSLHAGDGARLGPVSGQLWGDAGRCGDRAICPGSGSVSAPARRIESPDGRFGAHWWLKLNPEIGGSAPAAAAIAARRILCHRPRRPDADSHSIAPVWSSSGWARRSTSTPGIRPNSSRRSRTSSEAELKAAYNFVALQPLSPRP